jgi:hypothetical protein
MQPPDQQRDERPRATPDLFRLTWPRILFAAVVALAAFFLPQEVPLEWYPLNNPSSGLRYLEITCAANTTGNTQIFLNSGRGINELEKIRWPIGPSEMAFTYTFPLADAPLRELRLDPIDATNGELRITNFRLLNRRGEELRRFSKDSFTSLHGSLTIEPTPDGWKMIPGPSGGWAHIDLRLFSVPEGMNERNLKRCLLSTGYLAMMLWIILLAVFFTFRAPEPWRKTVSSMAFLAVLALCFAPVGNRGLIRNSIRYADTPLPAPSRAFTLELDVATPTRTGAQLFWDIGHGIREEDSGHVDYAATPVDAPPLQTIRFPLPSAALRSLRFDPLGSAGRLDIRRIRVVDSNGNVRLTLPVESAFEPAQQIAKLEHTRELIHDILRVETTPDANDPILHFKPDAVAKISAVLSGPAADPRFPH